ncbi:MAG: MFS transporter [Cyanobacteria bacterium SID2]|nr:MFS transporter [Cyanobacteria bacterium SID2]MBP0002288.1 MFS transporter [Cyanobacteria bacterium SBC]
MPTSNAPKVDLPPSTLAGISPDRKPVLIVLLAAACVSTLTGAAIAPVFPDMVEQLQLDPRWAGTLVSAPRLTIALASPILGLLADRTGKSRILVFSLIGFSIFGMMGGLLQDFAPLLVVRGLVGVANGGISAASLGLVASWFDGETRSRLIGYTASAIAVTSTIVPLVAGGLGSFGWQYAFTLYGLAIPIAIAAVWIVNEPKSGRGSDLGVSSFSSLWRDLRRSKILIVFLSLACSSMVFYTVIAYAPQHFKQSIDADSLTNGIILATRSIGAAIIAAIGASQLARRFGSIAAIGLGFGLMSVTVATIPVVDTVQLALIAAFGFGIGFGLVMPSLYNVLADLSSIDNRSTLLALGTGFASLGQFFAPILLGGIWERGYTDVFWVTAAIAIAIAVLQIANAKFHR